MKMNVRIILPLLLISALLILLNGCFPIDESPGYTPAAISGTIARPEVCCEEPSESYLVGDAISPNVCDVLDLCDPQHTADWYAWANVEVTLTTWVDCEEVEIASTMTDENGNYLFENVPAGRNYIITAICPEEIDFKVKDVAEEVVEGETYDAGIADAESTVLALCLEGLGEICLDSDVLDLDDFRNHWKYEKVTCEVCEKLAECLHALPVWVCEITELCPGWEDGDDDDDDDECESSPTADAGPDQELWICTGDVVSVDFTGSGTGFGTLSYAWDLNDNGQYNDSTEKNPQDDFGEGIHTVGLQVTDECNNSDTDDVIITVTECINQAPELVQPPRQAISVELVDCVPTYKYTVVATDPDSVNLKFSLVENSYGHIPAGMVIDENTGVITGWTPECCDGVTRCHVCCTECVKVKVEDEGCCEESLSDEMEFCIEVWVGTIDADGQTVGIGFDGCDFLDGFCD